MSGKIIKKIQAIQKLVATTLTQKISNQQSHQMIKLISYRRDYETIAMSQVIRGINTNGAGTGEVKARYINDVYELVKYLNIADPLNDDF